MLKIELVRTQEQAERVRELAFEFIDWLHVRYPEMKEVIETYFRHQQFNEKIGDLLIHNAPPNGECLLAYKDGVPVGTLMLKRLDDDVCEMNRMFVRESARGLGAGRALVERLKERGVEMGFARMILSALPRHHEAVALYASVGFEHDNRPPQPGESTQDILMKLELR